MEWVWRAAELGVGSMSVDGVEGPVSLWALIWVNVETLTFWVFRLSIWTLESACQHWQTSCWGDWDGPESTGHAESWPLENAEPSSPSGPFLHLFRYYLMSSTRVLFASHRSCAHFVTIVLNISLSLDANVTYIVFLFLVSFAHCWKHWCSAFEFRFHGLQAVRATTHGPQRVLRAFGESLLSLLPRTQ